MSKNNVKVFVGSVNKYRIYVNKYRNIFIPGLLIFSADQNK